MEVAVTERIYPTLIESPPRRRHDGRVERQSSDFPRLQRLDRLGVTEDDASTAVVAVCAVFDVPVPRLRFHARRSPFTGATELPRSVWIARTDPGLVARYEMSGAQILSENGAIRLGRTTTLMTVAHELGHHVVHCLDPHRTAAHGNVWIGRFDVAAQVIDDLVVRPLPVPPGQYPEPSMQGSRGSKRSRR